VKSGESYAVILGRGALLGRLGREKKIYRLIKKRTCASV
jgi:hypothetical protein